MFSDLKIVRATNSTLQLFRTGSEKGRVGINKDGIFVFRGEEKCVVTRGTFASSKRPSLSAQQALSPLLIARALFSYISHYSCQRLAMDCLPTHMAGQRFKTVDECLLIYQPRPPRQCFQAPLAVASPDLFKLHPQSATHAPVMLVFGLNYVIDFIHSSFCIHQPFWRVVTCSLE